MTARPRGRRRRSLVVHALTGSADAAGDWWEPLIGPGRALDTDRIGVLGANLLGGRYGTTGPTSHRPADRAAVRRGASRPSRPATRRAPSGALLDALGIDAARRSSSAARSAAWSRSRSPSTGRTRSGRSCRSPRRPRPGPMAVAWNHIQIELIDRLGLDGLALARELAMTTYRSEADFDERFGRERRARRPAVDRQLPRPPGPQARRSVRPGDRTGSWPVPWTATTSASGGAASAGAFGRLAAAEHAADRRRHRGRHPLRAAAGPRARRRRARRRGRRRLPRDALHQGPRRVPGRVGSAHGHPAGGARAVALRVGARARRVSIGGQATTDPSHRP